MKLLLIIPLLLVIVMPVVFAQGIAIHTDKFSYYEGEVILISGQVIRDFGTPISITIKSLQGDIVFLDQITVNSENKFNSEMYVGGSLIKYNEDYIITVTHGDNIESTIVKIVNSTNIENSTKTIIETGKIRITPPPKVDMPLTEEEKLIDTLDQQNQILVDKVLNQSQIINEMKQNNVTVIEEEDSFDFLKQIQEIFNSWFDWD